MQALIGCHSSWLLLNQYHELFQNSRGFPPMEPILFYVSAIHWPTLSHHIRKIKIGTRVGGVARPSNINWKRLWTLPLPPRISNAFWLMHYDYVVGGSKDFLYRNDASVQSYVCCGEKVACGTQHWYRACCWSRNPLCREFLRSRSFPPRPVVSPW